MTKSRLVMRTLRLAAVRFDCSPPVTTLRSSNVDVCVIPHICNTILIQKNLLLVVPEWFVESFTFQKISEF